MAVPRSLEEIIESADDLADAFEQYDPAPGDADKASPLVALRIAAAKRARAERLLLGAVVEAREHSVTWAAIGSVLGTTGEAARQRYMALVKH
jgi:hypothetical protein